MFRSQPYLEKTAYVQVNLGTPLTYPGNNQTQNKSGHKFTVRDRDNFYDWYNAYFLSLRPWQMEQTLALTLNQRRSTVLSRWSNVWILNQREKLCTRVPISTGLFPSKTCSTFRRFFEKRGYKPILVSRLWRNHSDWWQCDKRRNAGKGTSVTWRCEGSNYYPFEPILLLRRSIRQAAATNVTWVWNCSARRQRNDFPKR